LTCKNQSNSNFRGITSNVDPLCKISLKSVYIGYFRDQTWGRIDMSFLLCFHFMYFVRRTHCLKSSEIENPDVDRLYYLPPASLVSLKTDCQTNQSNNQCRLVGSASVVQVFERKPEETTCNLCAHPARYIGRVKYAVQ
jgi:hypothetical protein